MSMISKLKIPARIVLVGLLASVTLLTYFLAPSTGYTFAMGNGFNLKIDSKASWNGAPQDGTNGSYDSTWELKDKLVASDKFFNISDVKPGDEGEATISLHVNKDSWICLDFQNLKQKENGINEPEGEVDASGGAIQGELAAATEFFAWYDDGDNIFELGEKPIFGTSTTNQAATLTLNNKTYALADAIAGTPYPAGVTKYIGIQWCAGNMVVNVPAATITCDGTVLGNVAQTDSFSVDIGFRAVPSKDNKNFTCIKKDMKCEWPSCDGKCKTTITVDNNGFIINNTSSSSNTGGNSAGGSQGGSGGAGGAGGSGGSGGSGGTGGAGGAGGSGGTGGSGGVINTGNASSTATTTNILNRTLIRTR